MTISITASTVYDIDLPPAQLLTVTVTNTAPNAVPPNTAVTIWRVHADGTEHRVMVSTVTRVIPTTAVLTDYHCPYNVDVTYRVDAPTGSAAVEAYLHGDVPWLIHGSDPTLSVCPESFRAISDPTQDSRAVELVPVGGMSVFKSDGLPDGMQGSFTVKVLDEAPLRALLANDGVFLVNTPGPGWRVEWMWVQRRQVNWGTLTGRANSPYYLTTITYKQSADPDLDLTSPWTFDAVTALGLTFDQLAAAYATFDALTTNTPS